MIHPASNITLYFQITLEDHEEDGYCRSSQRLQVSVSLEAGGSRERGWELAVYRVIEIYIGTHVGPGKSMK